MMIKSKGQVSYLGYQHYKNPHRALHVPTLVAKQLTSNDTCAHVAGYGRMKPRVLPIPRVLDANPGYYTYMVMNLGFCVQPLFFHGFSCAGYIYAPIIPGDIPCLLSGWYTYPPESPRKKKNKQDTSTKTLDNPKEPQRLRYPVFSNGKSRGFVSWMKEFSVSGCPGQEVIG